MSLLMQALRKAERARVQNGHPAEHAEPQFGPDVAPVTPLEGGPAFAVMPDTLRLEPLEAVPLESEPPVVPAQEAAHDPVPPQARHEPWRAPHARSEAGQPPAREAPHTNGNAMTGSVQRVRATAPDGAAGTMRAGAHAPPPPRAIASSQRRLILLSALLLGLLVVFGAIYWRAVSGPGPGARLPMVPMPAPASAQLPPGSTSPVAGISVAPYLSGPAPTTPEGAATGPVTDGAAGGIGALASTGSRPGAAAEAPAGVAPPAPASRPDNAVTIPTPEQLAAIPDPAIRAEAMRDAAERAARQARNDVLDASAGAPAAPQPATAAPATATTASSAGPGPAARPVRPRTAAANRAPAPARTDSGLQTAVGENGDVRFVRGTAPSGIAPAVQNGYQALQSGDLAGARQQYDLALLQDPNNRDALLGAAAVALRQGDGRQASNNYLRLLELDPNDPEAHAGLAELRSSDLEDNEVKLKGLARKHPDSGPVQFALGNLFARQGRWPEAQQSYFRAYSAMPDNADYAYNLGVGLDRMNQPRLAQTYYRRALELAQAGPPAFSLDVVRKRLQALESPPR